MKKKSKQPQAPEPQEKEELLESEPLPSEQLDSEAIEQGEFPTDDGTEGGGGSSEGAADGSGEPGKQRKRKKVLSEERLKRIKEDYDKRGIIYVSRIPPHMKPMKLKQLLSQYGETLRVYCAAEDPSLRKMRKKKGGSSGKNFTEGWVEFADKRIAKRVALMLNGQKIGGKKRSAYHDDLWCCKYLKHFKWDHLTEEIAYQKAVREQRLATEISAAKRERDHYLAQVDRSKALAAMDERRAAKAATGGGVEAAGSGQPAPSPVAKAKAPAGPAKATAPAGPAEGGEAGDGSRKRKVNTDIGQRLPKADPAGGGITGRELADDVLMMVARNKRAKT